jgi:hypothetical protein
MVETTALVDDWAAANPIQVNLLHEWHHGQLLLPSDVVLCACLAIVQQIERGTTMSRVNSLTGNTFGTQR